VERAPGEPRRNCALAIDVRQRWLIDERSSRKLFDAVTTGLTRHVVDRRRRLFDTARKPLEGLVC
jgi:hypothetical protein